MGAGHLGTESTLTTDGHYHPQIVKDSSGYLWRKGEEGPTTPTFYAQRSTNTNDDSSWNTEQNIGYDTEGYGHLMLVPMGSGQLMALYNDATSTAYNLKYSIYDGSWGATTTVVSDCKDNTAKADWDEYHWFSAVADSSNNVHVVYVDSDDNDLNYVYYNGSSWSSPTEIYKGTITHPTLTYDSTNNNLYAFFIESGRVRYVVASGTSWYNAATNLKINLNSPSYLGSAYSDTSKISIIWREGTSSPYTISFITLTCGITLSAVHLKGGVELRGRVPTNHTLQLEPR